MGCIIDPKLNELLLALLGDPEYVDIWWNSPNIAFQYNTPLKTHKDSPMLVATYIYQHTQGEGS